ncbi:MAG: B12-binding domain-containing radical SAM protein [Sphingosinicella sp.]
MKRLDIAIVDLVTNRPTRALYSRFMNANLAGLMSQAVAVWCEELGHRVRYLCFTGAQDIFREVGDGVDVVFISAFTRSAQTAYALSAYFRSRGVVTVLGGPHARCYPDDAALYFDYVLGFTDRELVEDVLKERLPAAPLGQHVSAAAQPRELPSARRRWKHIARTLERAPPMLKVVPMISSLGCPYQCSFCIDSTVAYQPLSRDELADDLRFIEQRMPDAVIGWQDPNFGVRFDEYLTTIEQANERGKLRFIAESSLSLLSEANVKRMASAGFVGLLPGIETWYGMGFKSKTGLKSGMAKVEQVADHVNMLLEHVPYVQTNFVLGLDDDEGPEPFELTKAFIDRVPGAFPAYSQRTAFGEATPENLDLQQAGRVLGFPFHFLDNNQVMNVVPRNYRWAEFYDRLLDLTEYSFSPRAIGRRWFGTRDFTSRAVNFVRAVSSEGFGRIRHFRRVRHAIATDLSVRRYLDRDSRELPDFYLDKIRSELGALWSLLPDRAVHHDPYAFMKKSQAVMPAEPERLALSA